MEVKNLITFMNVAELTSFTKAAEKLGYSQSTISFQIKQLEEELNCSLFERMNHSITLTEKGVELFSYAKQLLQLQEEFKENFAQSKIAGHIRIVTPDSICENMMLKNYTDFYSHYPEITLKFSSADTDDMFRILNRNEADVIFTLDTHVYKKDYIIAKEQSVKTHFVTSANSPLKGKKLSIRDIMHYPFILTEKQMGYRKAFDEKLASMSLAIEPVLEIGRTDIVTKILETENMISFLPDFVSAQKVKEGKLIYLDVYDFELNIWKQLIYHRNKWLSKPLRTFIAYVKEHEFE